MTITKTTVPIRSGWPNFDVVPPRPTPHWSYDPRCAKRLARVQSAITAGFSRAAKALEMRRLAAVD